MLASALAYAQAPGDTEHLIRLTQAAEPPRQELFRRLNRAPGGTAAIVRLRRTLLDRLPRHPSLHSVEHDLLHLLGSWFNPGFLQMRKVDWNSPAQLLEQIIHHEAVHQIDGWDDLRRRLQPDRRCYAFFHPQLGDEPLIFVEVALIDDMADAIAPLIESKPAVSGSAGAKTAVFYSISNCQPGLRGVSLGNFLIKKVADQLKTELPQLKTFCTLSPIPGFVRWLDQTRPEDNEWAGPLQRVAAWRQRHPTLKPDHITHMPKPLRQDLSTLCARFLVTASHEPLADPVARFHLDNGARLERINFAADLSAKGLRQSLGLMVNYLYDIGEVEMRREAFVNQKVSHSTPVRRLLKPQA